MRLEKDKEGWPALSEDNTKSFHQVRYVELPQNEKLYRVLDPASSDNSFCWMRGRLSLWL